MSNRFIFKFFLLWGALSSLVVLAVIKIGGNHPAIFGIKDAVIYLAMLLLLGRIRSRTGYILLTVTGIFTLLILVNYVSINPNYNAPINNLRQIIAPVLVLFFFSSLSLSDGDVLDVERFLDYLVLLICLFGFLELFFSIWDRVGLHNFFGLKGIPVDESGMSYMLFEPILGYQKRLSSTFIDPISAGHFFAAYLIYRYYFRSKYVLPRAAWIFSFAALLFAFSKGAMLQLFLALTFLNSRINIFLRLGALAIPVYAFYLLPFKKGVLIHLNGVYNAAANLSLFGHGLGSAGNYTKMFAKDMTLYNELGVSDTYLGSVITQIGLFGLLVWLALLFLCLNPRTNSFKVALTILASQVAVSLLSENTMNVTSFVLPAIVIAIAVKRERIGFEKN